MVNWDWEEEKEKSDKMTWNDFLLPHRKYN